jgi:hypothetical protein
MRPAQAEAKARKAVEKATAKEAKYRKGLTAAEAKHNKQVTALAKAKEALQVRLEEEGAVTARTGVELDRWLHRSRRRNTENSSFCGIRSRTSWSRPRRSRRSMM